MATIRLPGPRVIGYRWVRVTPSEGRLRTLTGGYVHSPDEAATCRQHNHSNKLTPARGCRCGYYGFWTLADLQAQDEAHSLPYRPAVTVQWGRIVPAEDGFRSQYQAVLGVALRDDDPIDQIVKRHRIVKLDHSCGELWTPDWNALEALGREYGIPWSELPESYRIPSAPSVRPDLEAARAARAASSARRSAQRATRSTKPYFCECGCGGRRSRKGVHFLPGHDAKLKSRLLREMRSGGLGALAAKQELQNRGWIK